MKKIAVLICYFGELPWYFPYFVHSCKFNPTIDVFFISDVKPQIPTPGNFYLISKTRDEINFLASKKLGFQVKIENGYKLCDFKPAYGLIFSEYIKGYDFWAQSDIDIIYGNIRSFITEEMLNEFDFISIRHDYTTGCFALYRNNALMNNIFKRSKDYELVFSSPTHYCFDECNFQHDPLTEGKSIFDVPTEIESFTHIIRLAEQQNEIKAHFDFLLLEGIPGKIKFDNGRVVFRNKVEGILYHLYWLKKIYFPTKVPAVIPDFYSISPTRIYH